jgi:diaminopimelate decarboxylase
MVAENNLEYPGLSANASEYAGKRISYLADRYGTPLIVYNLARIKENIMEIKRAFRNIPVKIHFAVKSNYNPYIVSFIIREGVGIDAANFNEVSLAFMEGSHKNDIIATPNNLSANDLENIRKSGVAINFDHGGQMELLNGKLPDTVSFRINPGIGKGEFPGITTGGKNVKFGISIEDAITAYSTAVNLGAKHFGIHMMTGSNVLDPEFFRESTKKFFDIAENISDRAGINFDFIDIGGGFGVPYREGEKSLDIGKVGKYISENFESSRKRGYFKNSCIIIEPGRYIMADAAILAGTVTSIKKSDSVLVGTDISMNSIIRIPLYGAYHRMAISGHPLSYITGIFNVVGQICENTDYTGKEIPLNSPEIGNIIIVMDAGAYVSSMSSNYNLLPRPAELAINGADEILTKGHENLHDMLKSYNMKYKNDD